MSPKQLSLAGHGWQFVPRIPFELGRLAAGDVVIVHHVQDSPKLRLAASGERVRIALGPGTRDPEEVLHDWFDGEPIEAPGWTLALDAGYVFPWPEGTSVWSTNDRASWPVELTFHGGPRDEMLYVQGPFDRARAPVLASLVDSTMQVVGGAQLAGASGTVEALELRYVHEGHEWRQWRYLAPIEAGVVVLVTAQTSPEGYGRMLALGQAVATQVRAR